MVRRSCLASYSVSTTTLVRERKKKRLRKAETLKSQFPTLVIQAFLLRSTMNGA